jgi:hypothetical protein
MLLIPDISFYFVYTGNNPLIRIKNRNIPLYDPETLPGQIRFVHSPGIVPPRFEHEDCIVFAYINSSQPAREHGDRARRILASTL